MSIYPFDGEDVEILLKNADTAMYHAKERDRNNCKFFSESMNEESERKLELDERLRAALARNELSVHYHLGDLEFELRCARLSRTRVAQAGLQAVRGCTAVGLSARVGLPRA